MKAEKDESLSTEVPSFTNSIQNAEIESTPPTKTPPPLKQRRGRAVKHKHKHEIVCSNYNCNMTKKPGDKWLKTKFPSETPMHYCHDCTKAIKKKWWCQFCNSIYTDPSHSKGVDTHEWIQCDAPGCGRWTHIHCELKHGLEIKALNDDSYKYYCLSCREKGKKNNSKRKVEYQSSRLRKNKNSKKSKNSKIVDLKKMIGGKGATSFNNLVSMLKTYNYAFSENYQTVDKLMKSSKPSNHFNSVFSYDP